MKSVNAIEMPSRHAFDESLDIVFSGAVVVVNTLPTQILDFNKDLVNAVIKNNVKVYFPSDFAS